MRRFVILLALLLSACGGGSSLPSSIDLSQPDTIVSFADTGTAPKKQTVTFAVNAQNYGRCGNGHFGVMLRADLSRLPAGPYSGVGVIGVAQDVPLSAKPGLPPGLPAIMVLQSWAGAGQPVDALLTPTISAMPDGTFVVSVISEKTPAGNTLRYVQGKYDSGAVLDPNPIVDMRRDSYAFFNAGGPPLCPYSLAITPLPGALQ